jgi:dihydrofolate reductase
MTINLIAAVGKRGQLGLDGKLPWHEPEDLQWFKKMTMGGAVVVGYRTAQTLPKLPGRHVIVMERDMTPEQVIAEVSGYELWIAGGAKTYEQWMPFIQRFYIASIEYDGPADTWMPPLPFVKQAA